MDRTVEDEVNMRDEGRSRNVVWWVVGGLLAGQAVVVALAFQVVPHPGGDNAAYLTLAHSLLERGAYLELWEPGEPPHAKYPPVFSSLLAALMALGASTWTAFKGVSVVFVSASIVLAFLWVRGRRGPAFAAGVAFLFLVADALVEASNWVLSEPPFLALTLAALWAADRSGMSPGLRGRGDGSAEGSGSPEGGWGAGPWVAAVCAVAILVYFTRSAGLPLVAAVGLWLALGRRWTWLGVFAAAFAVPALAWALRARAVGEADYMREPWLIDPYQEELGAVGLGDLVARVLANLRIYGLEAFPEGFVGSAGWAPILGLVLAALAVVGWVRRIRGGAGLAELFAPLYLGLILLWPEVWSGDRFALPLYPLLLFYAGEALVDGVRRIRPTWTPVVAGGAVVVLAVPALLSLTERVEAASACRELSREHGPYVCQPAGAQRFNETAAWSAGALPEDAAVYSRKPRIFFLLSGVSSRMYPQTRSPEELLARADAEGVSYVVLDQVDAMTARYLLPAIQARPEAFCQLEAWTEAGGLHSAVLAIRPAADGDRGGREPRVGESSGAGLETCPEDLVPHGTGEPSDLSSWTPPLLERSARRHESGAWLLGSGPLAREERGMGEP